MNPDVRGALTERAVALIARARRIAPHLRGADGRRELDPSDAASLLANDEVLEALDEAGRGELAAIRAALARLDAGRYGVCVSCGRRVDPARLAVLPHAPRCVSCEDQGRADT